MFLCEGVWCEQGSWRGNHAFVSRQTLRLISCQMRAAFSKIEMPWYRALMIGSLAWDTQERSKAFANKERP
jgi:hypothetical protein